MNLNPNGNGNGNACSAAALAGLEREAVAPLWAALALAGGLQVRKRRDSGALPKLCRIP